jgi:hypothetical protein
MIILGSQVPIDPFEYLYTLPWCALGHHYNAFQWLPLVCSIPIEDSPEVSVRITKGPVFLCIVFRRGHSFTHSFPTRWIHRESTLPAPSIGMPNKPLPHTTPGHTHVGSWLHYFHGSSLHESVLRFGHDDKAPNYRNPPNRDPNPSLQIPLLHTNMEPMVLACQVTTTCNKVL